MFVGLGNTSFRISKDHYSLSFSSITFGCLLGLNKKVRDERGWCLEDEYLKSVFFFEDYFHSLVSFSVLRPFPSVSVPGPLPYGRPRHVGAPLANCDPLGTRSSGPASATSRRTHTPREVSGGNGQSVCRSCVGKAFLVCRLPQYPSSRDSISPFLLILVAEGDNHTSGLRSQGVQRDWSPTYDPLVVSHCPVPSTFSGRPVLDERLLMRYRTLDRDDQSFRGTVVEGART